MLPKLHEDTDYLSPSILFVSVSSALMCPSMVCFSHRSIWTHRNMQSNIHSIHERYSIVVVVIVVVVVVVVVAAVVVVVVVFSLIKKNSEIFKTNIKTSVQKTVKCSREMNS